MSASLSALTLGGRMALRRLGGRSTLLVATGAGAFCTLAAWAERHADPAAAASFALRGPAFGLAIPLATYALVSLALGRARPEDAVGGAGVLGANRRTAAMGALIATSVVSAFVGLLTAATTVLIAYARVDAGTLMDTCTSAWIGGLTGWAYAFFFGAASTVGRRGGGRFFALLADWLLGPMVGVGAVLFPRAHALNLLGAEPVLGLPQMASAGVLVGLAVAAAGVMGLRTRG